MQQTLHALAVTLHVRPYRETSVLLDLWLRDSGRRCAVARGVRAPGKARRFAELGPLALNQIELAGQGAVASLRSHDTQRQFPLAGVTQLKSALYLNELLLRMLPEHDPHPELFDRYITLLTDWSAHAPDARQCAAGLRLFEAALLDELGYGLVFDLTVDGDPVDGALAYQVDPEQGVVPVRRGLDWPIVPGACLIALANGGPTDAIAIRALRDLMREIIRYRLGGRMLRAWLQ